MDDVALRPSTTDEAARLHALRSLHALDSGSDSRFDRIARTAALVLRAPRSAIVLVDEDRLWHKARVGIPSGQYPRAGSLADLMVRNPRVLFSDDVTIDPRFDAWRDSMSQVDVRFYAAAPLVAPGGEVLGVLAVGDPQAHAPHTEAERLALEDLAALASEMLVHDARTIDAEQRAQLDQRRVELALDAAGLGEFEWDIALDRVFVSERMKLLIGLTADSAGGQGGDVAFRFVHPDDAARLREEVERGLREEGRYTAEYRMVRPDDGRLRWMQGAGVMVADRDGARHRVIGVVRDITRRKSEEDHRETLLAEMDHRVKNVLAAVQSLAAQSARRTTSTDGFLSAFAGRLKAMASAHELLTATRWRGASLGHIAAAELGGLAPGQARWEGPDLILTPRAANAVSLALHELATNAVKYGALSVETGRVEVIWETTADGGFSVRWAESGGPPVAPPERRGFGSTLLDRVTGRELGGEGRVEYRADGVRAVLRADPRAVADPVREETVAEIDPSTGAGASHGRAEAAHGGVEGLRLLVVEDAVLLAMELEAGLVEAGAIVVGSAAELGEAMAMLDREIDAAVLDANLNGESVMPLAAALRDRGTPFVFATGYGERGAPEGFDAPVVRKPYNVHQIVRALAEATGRT
ncbi:MAG: HWE histidine kinase domain-containing protein [Caulobacter sp.]|nr:HWE histidine kinase domain-containing protein [Caulobacter sp.]